MIVETCPNCGELLIDIMLASNPPIPRKECFSCGWSWTGEPEQIEYKPFKEAKRMTQGDKLRSSSDRELADFLALAIGGAVIAATKDQIMDNEKIKKYLDGLSDHYFNQLQRPCPDKEDKKND